MEPAYLYRATGTRVIDGDTFVAEVDLGFRVFYSCTVRVRGINAPEKNKPGGQVAKMALEDMVIARSLLVQSYHDEQSFARWVCDVWNLDLKADPFSVADAMVESGRAAPFNKGDKWER